MSYEISENLIAAKKDRKWGFIDKEGNKIINFEYDDYKKFSEGLAAVEKDNKWGFIDENGNIIIDFQYSLAQEFSEGLAPVAKLDESFKEFGDITIQNFYIDKQGNKVIDASQYFIVFPFSRGRALVESNSGEYGYIDKQGNVVIGNFDN